MELRLRPSLLALPLLLASCASNSTAVEEPTEEPVVGPAEAVAAPSEAETRAWLEDFGRRYAYDVGYLEQLLDLSPDAFGAFASSMELSEHRVHLPLDAHYVGLVGALLADDCGQCTQLTLRMAVEAGVERSLLRQVLEDPERLPPDLRLVHAYATQVVGGQNADAATVARLRAALGDEGFAELAVNVLGARIYPGLRRALGAETACAPPTLDF
ncbi:hypothetical protein Pla163_05110 [Planctomycetes bacterium Pla163]|uniref:Carboxymuconolactone decarboxylase family protein n=1 Tax=Rohdeia mirabilis TaxID=2528008 RepID=A0A518CW00_9BACT|nr:hypothetical protein Pla163_05110 [Planctomycetes bacterium Pla163]